MAILTNTSTGATLARRVERASTWAKRAFGLLGRTQVGSDEGMWFSPCAAIHTIGMRTPIAVLFLDDRGTVLQIHPHVPPHKPAVMCPGAHVTVELGTAALATSDILIGDRLELSEA